MSSLVECDDRREIRIIVKYDATYNHNGCYSGFKPCKNLQLFHDSAQQILNVKVGWRFESQL